METALESGTGDLEEAVDLLYHLIVLLRASGLSIDDAISVLKARHG